VRAALFHLAGPCYVACWATAVLPLARPLRRLLAGLSLTAGFAFQADGLWRGRGPDGPNNRRHP
jgi:hypothetical protein